MCGGNCEIRRAQRRYCRGRDFWADTQTGQIALVDRSRRDISASYIVHRSLGAPIIYFGPREELSHEIKSAQRHR